ncbi:hypothetical protein T02_10639, partial [Trichinella nativa]
LLTLTICMRKTSTARKYYKCGKAKMVETEADFKYPHRFMSVRYRLGSTILRDQRANDVQQLEADTFCRVEIDFQTTHFFGRFYISKMLRQGQHETLSLDYHVFRYFRPASETLDILGVGLIFGYAYGF